MTILPSDKRNMKLSTSLTIGSSIAAAKAMTDILHEPTFNIAIDKNSALFYHEMLSIDTELHLRSSCSTLQRKKFACDAKTSHGRKTNEFLNHNKKQTIDACFETNAIVMEAMMGPDGFGRDSRQRRGALLEVSKRLLTSISPLTADALSILEPMFPKALELAQKAFTSHRRMKSSRVVRSKTEFEQNALEQELCTETSLSILAAHPKDIESSYMQRLGQRLANTNLVQLERMFNAIRNRNYESSDAIEDLLLRVCKYHTDNQYCQDMIDLAVIEVTPTQLLMSHTGDILFRLSIKVPRKLNKATLYTLHSNGRLLPDGTLQKLVITNSVLHVRNEFYAANGIRCTSNLEQNFCHHTTLTTLGCEGNILNSGDASLCPVESSKWDTKKPKLTTTEKFTLFSSTEDCTICKHRDNSLDGGCSELKRSEIIVDTGIISCSASTTRVYHNSDATITRFNISASPITAELDTQSTITGLAQVTFDSPPLWLIILSTILSLISALHLTLSATKELLRSRSNKKAEDTICAAAATTTSVNVTHQTNIQQNSPKPTEIQCDDTTSMSI